ncbi:hypothetical protein [cf. Phormidesmis sp. LEGE 11477]|nr:hypothetical protein [cf. Phormidesmis sp. LEGE 11477]
MTPKELLTQEIDKLSDNATEEMLTFLRFARVRHYRQKEQD